MLTRILALVALCATSLLAQQPTNVVIILADDMGYGDVRALNPKSAIPTPNIDSLARDGMTFTDGHSPSAVCTPTRYALLTGRYCWRSSLKRGVLGGYSKPLLEPGRATIASLLKTRGYRTGAVGKWHLGMAMPMKPAATGNVRKWDGDPGVDFGGLITDGPTHHGFDSYFGVSASLDMAPYVYIRDDRFAMQPSAQQKAQPFPAFVRKGPRSADFTLETVLDRLTDEATAFIRDAAKGDQPFFLYMPLTAPHKPTLAHPRFRGSTDLKDYGDFVTQVDWTVGQVLQSIDDAGVRDNTLVVYTSDNGSYMYRYDDPDTADHVDDPKVQGFRPEHHRANGPLRGTKADVWEAGHRVPFFVRWPGVVAEGSRSDATVCLTDWFATCAEVSGAGMTNEMGEDSVSLMPLLRQEATSRGVPVIHHSVGGMFAIRDDRWKLVAGNGSGGRQKPRGKPFEKPYQLFDLEADLEESTDRAAGNPKIVEDLTEKLESIRSAGRSAPLRIIKQAGPKQTNQTKKAEPPATEPAGRPNVLWVTIEDLSPMLGCYGDANAITPNLDRLAKEGIVYDNAFATSGVCAPARSCIITSMYPSTLGTQWMRCSNSLPAGVRMFPSLLREAGYHTTNNSKTDYNIRGVPKDVWDQSNGKANWRLRKDGQPFFHVRNFTTTHESKIRAAEKQFANLTKRLSNAERRDPSKVRVPAFYPDTPVVRRDLANLHELTTAVDKQVGDVLRQLDEDGLAENTIVFFYSDHGNGLPRGKRWLYDQGIRVPMIVRFPKKWQHLAPGKPGTRTDRLVSFVDLGATVLSLCGVKVPKNMHGKAFLGAQQTAPRQFIFGLRDRMDERYDTVRAVSDGRYKLIRNFRTELPYAQILDYMEQMPTMRELRRLDAAGELQGARRAFMWPTKPAWEFYDTASDPDEVVNLATGDVAADVRKRLEKALHDWQERTNDLGVVPEAEVHARAGAKPFATWAASKDIELPRVRNFARTLGGMSEDELRAALSDDEPAIRFWACVGLERQEELGARASATLVRRLTDPSGSVRVAAASALAQRGQAVDAAVATLAAAMRPIHSDWLRLEAINALSRVDPAYLGPVEGTIRASLKDKVKYLVRVAQHLLRAMER